VIERDYLMRMISMLTAAIARLLHLKKEKEYTEGIAEINRACRSMLGADGTFLDSFSDTQLLRMFGRDPELASTRWYVLGLLLKERGEVERLMGEERKALATETRALRLLLEAFLVSDAPLDPDHSRHIDELVERRGLLDLPPPLALLAARFFERTGRFAKAEDVHRDLLDKEPGHLPAVCSFYERLLTMSDDQLMRGNLPRAEIREALVHLAQGEGQAGG